KTPSRDVTTSRQSRRTNLNRDARRAHGDTRTRPPARINEPWVDAAAVAEHLSCDRGWVYENAHRLGAIRLGGGSKPRLRFKLSLVDQALNACSAGRESEVAETVVVEPRQARRPRQS